MGCIDDVLMSPQIHLKRIKSEDSIVIRIVEGSEEGVVAVTVENDDGCGGDALGYFSWRKIDKSLGKIFCVNVNVVSVGAVIIVICNEQD